VTTIDQIRGAIRSIPDFPKPGILFRDISPLLGNGEIFRKTIDLMAEACEGTSPAKIAGIDARGFIFGSALACRLGVGFVPIRKKGKLPYRTMSETFELEYGTDSIEMHEDGVEPGERVVLVDDLLATGGTARAALRLLHRLGAEIPLILFAVELNDLGGRALLDPIPVRSLVSFEGE